MIQSAEPIIPSTEEVELAAKSTPVLADYIQSTSTPVLELVKNKKNTKIALPPRALQILVHILGQMGQGHAISVIPIYRELTTQQAADLLNVSRPYLVSLLKDGKIPFTKVGTKRRVLAKDVIKYKKTINKKRLKTLEALSKQAQDLDMGY